MRDVRRVTAALRRWSLGGDLGAWPARGPGAFRALATLHGSRVAREVVDRGSGHEIVRDPASWRRPWRRASWEPWRAPFTRAAATLAPEASSDGDDAGEEIPRLPRLKRLKVGELRDLLARHGLDEAGIRDVLIDRLDRHRRDGAEQREKEERVEENWILKVPFLPFRSDAMTSSAGLNHGAPGPNERILRPDEHGIDPDLIPKHVRHIARRLRAPTKSSNKPRRRRRGDDGDDDDDNGIRSPDLEDDDETDGKHGSGAIDADERRGSPPPTPDDGLTAFERERRANIARNERVMATLNIPSGIPVAFAPAPPATATRKNKKVPAFDDGASGPPKEDPPIVVVDARPGDAAARYLRGRLLASSGDAAPRETALDFCPELREHQRHLADILTDTITGGQNNSVLLVGARGSGKTLVLDSALRQLREAHGDGVLPVRLNGMLHADERVAMREIAEQLCLGFKAEELEFSRAAGFAENVAFMREMLRVLENGRRGVVFVLEEFDLFAHRPKQTLLYAVMDLLQQTQVQAAVVGVTCRHDAAELLEKRVKSRFSSRRILLAPPVGRMRAATLVRHALSLPLPPSAKGGDEERGEGAAPETGAAASPTGIEPALVYPPDPGFAARWNEAVDAAVAQVGVDHTLRAYEALECTPRAASDLALFALACMDRDKGTIMAKDIMVASQRLLGDTYVRALSGVSALELCMVVAMSRLHRFRRKAVFNFNHVEDELKNMTANDFLGDAGRARGPTLSRAFEGLLAMGLVEAQTGGVGAGLGGAVTLRRGRGQSGHKHWREIRLLLTDEEVATAVGKHPNKPVGLSELLTHEGVRQTTAGC